MTKTSAMWLGDTTNIDMSYITNTGEIVGNSIRPKFIVAGKVDPVEQVVVDFSNIKKTIKRLTDDNERGLDHKLIWLEGYSAGNVTFSEDTVTIETEHVKITGPKNIVRIIGVDDNLETYLNKELAILYPNVDVTVASFDTSTFDVMPMVNTSTHPFTYVHGLRESTSWGCQNIAHGHLSYLAAVTEYELGTNLLLQKIAAELDGTVFVWKNNCVEQTDNSVKIDYSCSRGAMSMEVTNQKFVVIETESTVEHLVDYVAQRWGNELRANGVSTLFVSEGLSKGACVDLN